MSITVPKEKCCLAVIILVLGMVCSIATPAAAGPYRDSAHGNLGYGVNRSAIDDKYVQFATGNCAHCHETHASIEGSDPAPTGGPSHHTLFADSFNTARPENPYLNTDDFCFYCHSDNSGQQVTNQDYSTTFGGADNNTGPQSILETFNLASYHNLYDIWNFLSNDQTLGPWFAKRANPCSSCHNSHLAKRNWDSSQAGFPLLSVIIIPGLSDSQWGENEVMSTSDYIINYGGGYEAPYADPAIESREPGGVGEQSGGNTPDYNTFCLACHNPGKTIWSTTLTRNLTAINWSDTETNGQLPNKHGSLARDGMDIFRNPYTDAASNTNFVLSCLDCHEPHGSANTMLLRRRINGENLEGAVSTTDAMGYVCKRCHQDDLAAAAGTGEANRWEYVHHLQSDAPYDQIGCGNCHPAGGGGGGGGFMGGGIGGEPIPCGNCHGHGMTDSLVPVQGTGRITF